MDARARLSAHQYFVTAYPKILRKIKEYRYVVLDQYHGMTNRQRRVS